MRRASRTTPPTWTCTPFGTCTTMLITTTNKTREAHAQDQYVRDLGGDRPARTVCKAVLDCIEEEVQHMCVNCLVYFGEHSERGRGARGLWNCFDGAFARLRDKYGLKALTLDESYD